MKNCVYNIFEDVNETKFPGFKEVKSSIRLSICKMFFYYVFMRFIWFAFRPPGLSAFKNLVILSLFPVDGIIKFITWYVSLFSSLSI